MGLGNVSLWPLGLESRIWLVLGATDSMGASMGFLAQSIAPIGAVLGGTLATVIGVRLTLLVAVLGGLTVALWMLRSPLRHLERYSLHLAETS